MVITEIYHDLAVGYGQKPDVPMVEKACAAGASSAPLTGEIRALDWERYPGTSPTLWVPTVLLQLCNPGAELAGGALLIQSRGAAAFEGFEELQLPVLPTGAGTGWVKVFLPTGMPEGLLRLIEQRRLAWPEITVELVLRSKGKEQKLTEQTLTIPIGREGASTAQWQLPEEPSEALLRATNWTGRRMTTGSSSAELFLYAPEIRFWIQDLIGCNPPGGVGVESKGWSLWSLSPGGEPRWEGSLGDWRFQGSYTWSIEERPQVQSTFILLNHPPTCHYPGGASIWYYDPMRHTLAKPSITVGDKEVPAGAPSLTIQPDGGLLTYDLANVGEESPWIRVTYYWDQERLNWSLTAPPRRAPVDPPGAPPNPGGTPAGPGGAPSGPGGAPSSPDSVYP